MLEEVSACIIAKNEESNLPRLLESIKGRFFEIILVDTGSTDKTIEIARSYNCNVYNREWAGFADARNFAVEKASGRWVWHFDADTELEEEEYIKFKTLFSFLDKDLYEGIGVIYKNLSVDGRVKGYSSTVHIHKKDKDIKWVGKIHERVLNLKISTILIPNFKVRVLHYGYSVSGVQRDKAKRNIKLILEELRSIKDKRSRDHVFNLFYMVQSYSALASIEDRDKNLKRAIKYIEKFRELSNVIPDNSIFQKHFYVYASSIYRALNNLDHAMEILEEGLKLNSDYPDLIYIKGEILEAKGRTKDAVETYIRFLNAVDSVRSKTEAVITDYISLAPALALEKLPKLIIEKSYTNLVDTVESIWKKERGFYIGLLLFSCLKVTDPKKSDIVLTKLARFYEKEDIVYNLLASRYSEDKEKVFTYMLKAIETNPLNPQANLFFARKHEEEGNLLQALSHYKNYLHSVKDVDIYQKVQSIISVLKEKNA